MTDMNDAILLRLRSQYKRLEQLTWLVRELQNRFPLGDPESEAQLLKNYLSLRHDIEDILDEINKLGKEYVKGNK